MNPTPKAAPAVEPDRAITDVGLFGGAAEAVREREKAPPIPQIRVVVVGHMDHGKSTTIGRLFWDTDALDADERADLTETAHSLGREGCEYAFVLDRLRKERGEGMTIGLAHRKLKTAHSWVSIADAPGHREFIENMLRGASTSDAAVLVVAVDEGIREQCRQHLLLLETFGIRQILVVINKMDLAGWREEAFLALKGQIAALIGRHGFEAAQTPVLPCSALQGENIVRRSTRMEWHPGPTVLEALTHLHARATPVSLPLRLPIQDVYEIGGRRVPVGRLETGTVLRGETLVSASGRSLRLERIQIHDEPVAAGEAGDNLYLFAEACDGLARGDVLGRPDDAPALRRESRLTIALLADGFRPGERFTLRAHTAQAQARIEEIEGWIDSATGVRGAGAPDRPVKGEVCEVRVTLDPPICLEPQNRVPHLARVALFRGPELAAEGLCTG